MPPIRRSLVLAVPFLIAACGGDSESDSIPNDGETVVTMGLDDDDDGLGSVHLPRPTWLPADFPLPKDAKIFITVAKEDQDPPIYMIQARTRSDGEAVADAIVAWGKSHGLDSARLEARVENVHLATLAKGNGLENANLQVLDHEDGIRQIVLAVSGKPWE
ncbi:hypothetical protein [Altererythrobacter sp. Z27]|uniref:hypothetical protein n=1 Tax=Altererythrobacter sp. Z27 TaxID=3461147 RepID=UPI004043AF1F